MTNNSNYGANTEVQVGNINYVEPKSYKTSKDRETVSIAGSNFSKAVRVSKSSPKTLNIELNVGSLDKKKFFRQFNEKLNAK